MRSIFSDPDASLEDIAKGVMELPEKQGFEVMARWLGSGVRLTGLDRKASVVFHGSTACFANMATSQVTLSAIAMADTNLRERALITLGFAIHEAGHLLFDHPTHEAVLARWGKTKDLDTATLMSNIVGDRYNEWYLTETFKGTARPLQVMRQYMSGSAAGWDEHSPHPKRASYPGMGLVTTADVRNTFVLAGAYDGYVSIPGNYGISREVRKVALFVQRTTRGLLKVHPTSEEYVAAHLAVVETLLRAWKRYTKDLPEPPLPPEPPKPPKGGTCGPVGPGGTPGGSNPGGDDDEDEDSDDGESKPETKRHPYRAPVALAAPAATSLPCTECGLPESDPVHAEGTGKGDGPGEGKGKGDETQPGGGKGDEPDEDTDETEPGKGEGKDGDEDGEDEDDDGDEPGKGNGTDGEDETPKGSDIHAPGGQRGGTKESEAMAEALNEALKKALDDPFIKDNDILTGEEGTGTIDRSGPKYPNPARHSIGEADADLSEAMRQAFVRSRLSHDHYTAGFRRGRLRSRDACKAPAGVDDLFSQKADRSATKVHIALLVDYSSSMHQQVRYTDTFVRSLAEATRNTNVRVSVWTYDTASMQRVWESTTESEAVLEENLIRSAPSGGTVTGTCLAMLSDEIARTRYPGERTVVLSVTDGQPADPQVVRQVVEDLRERDGVAVAGVYIGGGRRDGQRLAPDYMLDQYGEDAIPFTGDWAELGEDLMDIAGLLLSGAREV